jgi:long-chain acyl-CoA synthetase
MIKELVKRYVSNRLMVDQSGRTVYYSDLLALSSSDTFSQAKGMLVLCEIDNDIDGILGYLSLLVAGSIPIMVSPAASADSCHRLLKKYNPPLVFTFRSPADFGPHARVLYDLGNYALLDISFGSVIDRPHDELCLLLSTSGSTGSSKFVRLSKRNVWSNAAAISRYLELRSDELPITSLPPSYSYGLSVIHSHLFIGAGLAVISKSLFERDFWRFLVDVEATSFSGVPYHYEILNKLRFTSMHLPSLRTLTQAGGAMKRELTMEFARYCQRKGMRFFTMYGQTEASPRMSYVPAESSVIKAGTIGVPVPGSVIELRSDEDDLIDGSGVVGELVYRGPNVCMGYAEGVGDLRLGDLNQGVLYTGDLAERDDDGYYRIVGRKSRFIKLYGNRVNLQEVESFLSGEAGEVACCGRDDFLEIYVSKSLESSALQVKRLVMDKLRVGGQAIAVYGVDLLPRSQSGKIRYGQLNSDTARRLD